MLRRHRGLGDGPDHPPRGTHCVGTLDNGEKCSAALFHSSWVIVTMLGGEMRE